MAFKKTLTALVLGIASLVNSCNYESRNQEKPAITSSSTHSSSPLTDKKEVLPYAKITEEGKKTEEPLKKPSAIKQEIKTQELTPTTKLKKTSPLIEILDDNYKFEVLADGLNWPTEIVVNPLDDRIFFVQRTGTKNEGVDGVHEIINGKVECKFVGASDVRSGHLTKIAINQKNEMFIYDWTHIDEHLRIWDLKTGKQVLEINRPFKDGREEYDLVSNININPQDGRLYIMRGPIYVLDRKEKKVIPWKDIGSSHGFCFDSDGNLYAPVFEKGLIKFSPNGKTEKVREPKIVGIPRKTTESEPETYWDLGLRRISDRTYFIGGCFYEAFENDDPRVKGLGYISPAPIKSLEGKTIKAYHVLYSFDQEKNEAKPLVRINDVSYASYGDCLDTHGNLYFSTFQCGSLHDEPGQIIKVSKK